MITLATDFTELWKESNSANATEKQATDRHESSDNRECESL